MTHDTSHDSHAGKEIVQGLPWFIVEAVSAGQGPDTVACCDFGLKWLELLCGWRWETLELYCVVRGFVFVHEPRFIDFGAKVLGQNLPLPTLPLLARITTAPIPARHWGVGV